MALGPGETIGPRGWCFVCVGGCGDSPPWSHTSYLPCQSYAGLGKTRNKNEHRTSPVPFSGDQSREQRCGTVKGSPFSPGPGGREQPWRSRLLGAVAGVQAVVRDKGAELSGVMAGTL